MQASLSRDREALDIGGHEGGVLNVHLKVEMCVIWKAMKYRD